MGGLVIEEKFYFEQKRKGKHDGDLLLKIERGETKLNLEKLEQIAQIFNTDIIEFINNREGSVLFFMNRNSDYTNYSTGNDALIFEIEKLKLTVHHQ